jgi:hypothetical protein
MRQPWSPQTLARWIGILLLVSLVAGSFGEAYVPSKIMVAGDAAATAQNIIHQQTLFRFGYAGYVVEGLCDAALTALLYLLLRPAGRELALVALLLRVVATAAFAAAESSYFAALPVLSGAACVLMALAGLSFVLGMSALIVAPAYATPFLLLPMIIGMLVLAVWLLVRGVELNAWRRMSVTA